MPLRLAKRLAKRDEKQAKRKNESTRIHRVVSFQRRLASARSSGVLMLNN